MNYQRRNSLINAFSWLDTVIPNVVMIWQSRRLFGINKMVNGLSLPGVIRRDIGRSIEESILAVLYYKSNKSFIHFGGHQLEIN